MATCSPVIPQPALSSEHPLTQVTCFFSQPSEGKGLWDTLQSRSTEEPQTKILLTFCHRDRVLYWFLLLMRMSPLFLDLFSYSTSNLERTGVCAFTNHQTQRFQVLPSENSTFQLKNCVWTEPLSNRCIFSSLFISIFWIKWIVVIISAIFSLI